jgi:hypothetical protein
MPKKLAITIAGAVSLGSYESGVLYEVLDAIRQHNANPATDGNSRIEIDVLTGASAGGMTAIILAQKLMFSADQFKGAYDNPLYNTWVKRISLEGLQQTGQDEPALHSLLSSNLIETISKEALLERYETMPPPPGQRHPAAASLLRVGVALTNLNGVAYGYPVTPGGKFVYIDYGDQRTRLVDPANNPATDSRDFWEPLRQAAVACGAFPIAFRAQDVERSKTSEPDDYPVENLEPWDQDPSTYTYSDGGILQNQPLGIAKNLVDLIDRHEDQDQRFYMFVSPQAKDPNANDNFHEENADYLHVIQRLLDVVVGQSGFQDWITAKGVNKRIALLDERADGLKLAILNNQVGVQALGQTATSLLSLFFPDGSHLPPGATEKETLVDAQARIAKQYKDEIAALSGTTVDGVNAGTAFRDSVLAFESAAGLGARDHMTIYGVTATETELAGAGVQYFLGFFDQDYRDHDYDVGRTHAQSVLKQINDAFALQIAQEQADALSHDPGNSPTIAPLRFTPGVIRPIDSRLDGLKLKDVPAADLAQFKGGMKRRLNQMLRELVGPVAVLADPVADLLLDAALNQIIAKF